ncbi:MAG: CopG family transcriptional regulator [Syntrophomonadaceae bacterium]|nr:CopG family transcriptional regulator [Syntrophomonadaceae bacterium]
MPSRLGVIGIVVEDMEVVPRVNQILSHHSQIIVGRMGIPYRQRGVSVIALIIDGDTDEIGSLTGKLGSLKGVSVKSALTTRQYPDGG